jgi:hypothetical protein
MKIILHNGGIEMLKIFGYSYCGEDEYGVSCGIVIAENLEKAIQRLASNEGTTDFDNDDIEYVKENYTIKEIPFKAGSYFIDSYFE